MTPAERLQVITIAHQLDTVDLMVQALKKQVEAALASPMEGPPSIVARTEEKQEERPRHYGRRPLSRQDVEPPPDNPSAA